VKKRDGRTVPFDKDKIFSALEKAFTATNEGKKRSPREVSEFVLMRLREDEVEVPTVEQIQDLVEETLMRNGYYQTAKSYIMYRAKRQEVRNLKSLTKDTYSIIEEYISKNDWRVAENSNMSYSLQGLNNHISSSVTSKYWLNKIYPADVGKAHTDGFLHIHDLGILASYCVGWDLELLLIKGFGGVNGKISSKPAKHFRTALGQVVNFFFTLQGETAGAQAFSNFDTLLAPFIRYDGLDYAQVKQCMQEFVFNLNVPTRTGFQTPFTNLTLDLMVPRSFYNKKVIIGGREREETYKDFQKEIYAFNRAFAEVMEEGDANGRIFTFPIPTYNVTKEFEWDNPEFDEIWRMTAKYGTPYFANFVNSAMDVEDTRSMCCRLRLDTSEIKDQSRKLTAILMDKETKEKKEQEEEKKARRGGLFASNPMTGSIGVVTVNLPRIAKVSGSKKEFFDNLRHYMGIARASLEIKRKIVEEFTDHALYPYTKIYLGDIKASTGHYWAHHFSTVGLVGMNEAVQNLLHIPYNTDEGRKFAEETLDFMVAQLEEFKKQTNSLYNLEASPAEGTSYRLARIDKKSFPDIITAGTDEVPYYTNSVHLPVNASDDVFYVLNHQNELQAKFTGGTVVHLFLGEAIKDISTVKELVKRVCSKYKLPYFSVTPTFSVCPVHGYLAGEHPYCPHEHSKEQLERFGIEIPAAKAEKKILHKAI
jgi:ribonucleoside-triphosphate reductase